MLLRAGLVSLALLLASRLLGLLRESVQAAALGATGLADAAILMLTLPDLLTGLLASGALAYVLLPLWARQGAAAQAATQARLARGLLAGGAVAGAALLIWPMAATALLAPGLDGELRQTAHRALAWSAVALPLALLAALWTTRLQHQRDFTGMYGANLAVNAAVVAALLALPLAPGLAPLALLGCGLLLGMLLRLAWLRHRLHHTPPPTTADVPQAPDAPVTWPTASIWLWALASAGLPLALPLLARSLASAGGEGALTTFNYAWKLVELPLVLAIQLVASLSFPGIARAFAPTAPATAEAQAARRDALRSAFVLAWVLACAAAAALANAAPALAQLLFGWGRMPAEAVAQVAAWGRVGAWSLLPQALLAVLLTLMASTGRLRGAVLAYLGALTLMAALALLLPLDGARVMALLGAALALAAVALLVREREFLRGVLPWRDWLPPALAATGLAVSLPMRSSNPMHGLVWACFNALLVIAIATLCSPGLRRALRR